MCDLVHEVDTIVHLSYLLTTSENLLLKMSDVRETAILQFPGHHLYFRNDFQMLFAVNIGHV